MVKNCCCKWNLQNGPKQKLMDQYLFHNKKLGFVKFEGFKQEEDLNFVVEESFPFFVRICDNKLYNNLEVEVAMSGMGMEEPLCW